MKSSLMWIRLLTAAVLFVLLSKVNVWADTGSHLVLAVGYRALLLMAPLFLLRGAASAMKWSLVSALSGGLWALCSVDVISMFLIALGMAVSGYVAKLVLSQTSRGAADNKVSLNLGSLVSGALLLLISGRISMLLAMVGCLLVSLVLAFRMSPSSWSGLLGGESQPEKPRNFRLSATLGWGLIGVATGVKLTGVFTILPQVLLAKTGVLPSWFGTMVMINSVGVILVQHRVMRWLDGHSPRLTFTVAGSAMVLLALPSMFRVQYPVFAGLWIGLLTLGECALSRYDRIAQSEGYLFTKEVMVGTGSLLTVLLSRDHALDPMWSGVIGTFAFVAGVVLVSKRAYTPRRFRSWVRPRLRASDAVCSS